MTTLRSLFWFASVVAALGFDAMPHVAAPDQEIGSASRPRKAADIEISTLSSRSDMVSGGEALVEIRLGAAAQSGDVAVSVNGRTIAGVFRRDAEGGSLIGLVDGLRTGSNTVVARAGSDTARLQIINFPITGPIVSGPHLSPFACRTEEAGLGPPRDEHCTAPVRIEYFYRSTEAADGRGRGRAAALVSGAFKPLEPQTQRPADLATTTTTDGRTVPYIVRVESGTINRAIYRIAVLDDPSSDGSIPEWRPGPGWNRRLMYSFGGGCGASYTQGIAPMALVLFDPALSRGDAHVISSQNMLALHCNDHLSGEAAMMIKEHFIERYGIPTWTMGVGVSGGAIQQLLIAQNFPGLLDGLVPGMTYADSITVRPGVTDCRLLSRVFNGAPDAWTPEKRAAVEGYAPGTCTSWIDRNFVNNIVADYAPGCGIAPELVYHPTNNPRGARCTVWDTNAASYTRDPATGFARRTLDNVGVQYGLLALERGAITPAEFIELNARIGGFDNDGHVRDARTVADSVALRLAYATGRVNAMRHLGAMPIIHIRPYLDGVGDIHSSERDFTVRARLRADAGHSGNQAIWVFPAAADQTPGARLPGGYLTVDEIALDTMRQWLDRIAADRSAAPALEKVTRARPGAAIDGCWDRDLRRIDEPAAIDATGRCSQLYPPHATPRLAAGAPLTDDVLKCQLKPIDPKDYTVTFAPAQIQALARIFPGGVCDYAKPGVGQQPPAGTYLRLPLQ